MLAWVVEEAESPGNRHGNANHNDDGRERNEAEQKLPPEKTAAVATPAHPSFADVAFAGDDAIEEDEAHDAVDVDEERAQYEPKHNYGCDQGGEHRGVIHQRRRQDRAKRGWRSALMIRKRGTEIAAAGAHLPGQQSDEGEARPLAEAEWVEELLLGALESGAYGFGGGDWHARTSNWLIARR